MSRRTDRLQYIRYRALAREIEECLREAQRISTRGEVCFTLDRQLTDAHDTACYLAELFDQQGDFREWLQKLK